MRLRVKNLEIYQDYIRLTRNKTLPAASRACAASIGLKCLSICFGMTEEEILKIFPIERGKI